MQTQELYKKALVTTSDIAAAGKMNAEQSDTFINYVYDMTFLRNVVRLVRFSNESMNLDKIAVHTRVMLLKQEARGSGVRRGVSTSQVTLQPVDVTVPWEISDNFADFNIEGEDVYDTIARLMATQFANDWEEMLISSDTRGVARLQSDLIEDGSTTDVVKDTTMAAYDGWLRLADAGNLYDAEGADISPTLLSKIILQMPRKFRRIKRDMRFLVSMDHEQLYRERVGARQTPAGDDASSSQQNLTPWGVPLVPVPLLDRDPMVVDHITLGAAPATGNLTYNHIPTGSEFYVTPQALGNSPTTPYVEGAASDYTVDRTNGTITSVGGGAMAAGGNYKVSYRAGGQLLLSDYMNLIMAIGRDIRLEHQRNSIAAMNQYVIHARVHGAIEEVTAVVKAVNIGMN